MWRERNLLIIIIIMSPVRRRRRPTAALRTSREAFRREEFPTSVFRGGRFLLLPSHACVFTLRVKHARRRFRCDRLMRLCFHVLWQLLLLAGEPPRTSTPGPRELGSPYKSSSNPLSFGGELTARRKLTIFGAGPPAAGPSDPAEVYLRWGKYFSIGASFTDKTCAVGLIRV